MFLTPLQEVVFQILLHCLIQFQDSCEFYLAYIVISICECTQNEVSTTYCVSSHASILSHTKGYVFIHIWFYCSLVEILKQFIVWYESRLFMLSGLKSMRKRWEIIFIKDSDYFPQTLNITHPIWHHDRVRTHNGTTNSP